MNSMQATPPPQKMLYVCITINFWPLSIPWIQHWFQLCCWEAEVDYFFFFCGLTTEKELSALVRQMDRHLARPAAFNRKGMRLYNRTSICYTREEIQHQLENEPSQGPRGAAPLWNAHNPPKKAGVERGARRRDHKFVPCPFMYPASRTRSPTTSSTAREDQWNVRIYTMKDW